MLLADEVYESEDIVVYVKCAGGGGDEYEGLGEHERVSTVDFECTGDADDDGVRDGAGLHIHGSHVVLDGRAADGGEFGCDTSGTLELLPLEAEAGCVSV